jgi:hypothetical protein
LKNSSSKQKRKALPIIGKNTTLADFPVIENWLLASVEKNPFYQLWFDELLRRLISDQAIYSTYPSQL